MARLFSPLAGYSLIEKAYSKRLNEQNYETLAIKCLKIVNIVC